MCRSDGNIRLCQKFWQIKNGKPFWICHKCTKKNICLHSYDGIIHIRYMGRKISLSAAFAAPQAFFIILIKALFFFFVNDSL